MVDVCFAASTFCQNSRYSWLTLHFQVNVYNAKRIQRPAPITLQTQISFHVKLFTSLINILSTHNMSLFEFHTNLRLEYIYRNYSRTFYRTFMFKMKMKYFKTKWMLTPRVTNTSLEGCANSCSQQSAHLSKDVFITHGTGWSCNFLEDTRTAQILFTQTVYSCRFELSKNWSIIWWLLFPPFVKVVVGESLLEMKFISISGKVWKICERK